MTTWPCSAMYSTIASTSPRRSPCAQCARDRLVDDLHGAAADELLELDQREVRLHAGRVAVHHEADRPGRGEHRAWALRQPFCSPRRCPSPTRWWPPRGSRRPLCRLRLSSFAAACLRITAGGPGRSRVPVVRADHGGELGRALVRGPVMSEVIAAASDGHPRVVPVAGGHEQGAEVGVADAELAEARVVSPIAWVGKSAKQIEMSIAVMTSSTALTNRSTSNVSSRAGTSAGSARRGCTRSCPGACTPSTGWTR